MKLELAIKQQFWIVGLVGTTVAAFLGASGVSHIATAAMVPSATDLAAPPPVAAAKELPESAAPFHSTSADAILSRNPFDSTTGALHPKEPAAEPDPDTGEPLDQGDPRAAPTCDGVKLLVVVASGNPDQSLAAFEGEPGKTLLRRRGGDVGGKLVEFIGWDRVWLSSGGSLCQAQMFKPGEAAAPVQAVVTPVPESIDRPKVAGSSLPPEISKGIRRLGANEFEIDRSVVDQIMERQAELIGRTKTIPETENGKIVGIRLGGIKSDSLLGTLGLENGDRLSTINGFDIGNPEKALEAYARLRTADKLTIALDRRGAPTQLDFHIK